MTTTKLPRAGAEVKPSDRSDPAAHFTTLDMFGLPRSGQCRNCGQKLSRSIDTLRGYCTRCARALLVLDEDLPVRDRQFIHPHPDVAIICERIRGVPHTNVPRYALDDLRGFEWGDRSAYGQRQLALNICEHYVRRMFAEDEIELKALYEGACTRRAERLAGAFAARFIVPMDYTGGAFEAETITRWIKQHLARADGSARPVEATLR